MDKMRYLWKNLWENRGESCGNGVKKLVESGRLACSGCSVWWENVRFYTLLFGFGEFVRVCGGKGFTDVINTFVVVFHGFHIVYNYYY